MAKLDLSRLSLADLRKLCLRPEGPPPGLARKLQADRRQGARNLIRLINSRRRAARREDRRLKKLLSAERELWDTGFRRVAGVDEAGVGCLAGPVVAASVIWPPHCSPLAGVDDSKRLTPEERKGLAEEILKTAFSVGIGIATVAEIDRMNVYQASLLAMQRSIHSLSEQPDFLLLDARRLPSVPLPQRDVIGGDQHHFSIAAASIIAKTHRDQLMEELGAVHPGYGFEKHRGYATPDHQAAIRSLGLTPEHRTSYQYLQELCGEFSEAFYELQAELETAAERTTLGQIKRRMNRAALSLAERKKLLLVYRRRSKGLPALKQLALPGTKTGA